VVGALGYRGLDAILGGEARLQAESRRWNDVALLFSQMSEDLTMAVSRTARDNTDRTGPALWLPGSAQAAPGGAQLTVTRLGIGEGAPAQSAPRRVGYRLRHGTLEYLVWPELDAAPDSVPSAYVLLGDVTDVQWQALDADGRWSAQWPAAQPATALPRAVSVRIVLAGGEQLTRILALR
jgi:type II secretion system protein J